MKLSESKILITGASGSLGKQIIYELHRQGVNPIALVRDSSDTSYIDSLNLEKRECDLRQAESFPAILEGIDAIIHTAAWVNFRQDRLTQFTGINTVATAELFKAAQTAGVKRFLHVSTVAAIGALARKVDGQPVDPSVLVNESFEFNLEHLRIPYIMTKHAAETELNKLVDHGSTELVIVNPSIIIAPSRTGDDRGKAMKSFSHFIMPQLPNRVNLVDIRDVVPAIVTALERGRNKRRYILAGDDIEARDLVLTISSILGKTPHLVRLPRRLYDLIGQLGLWSSKLSGKGKVSVYPDLVRLLNYDWVFSSALAREDLHFRSRSIYTSLTDLLTNKFVGTWLKH